MQKLKKKKKKKKRWFWNNNFNSFKWRNKWFNENFEALEDSTILLKGVTKTIKNEAKEQKGGFLIMLLGPRNCKSWYWKTTGFLMLTYPLTNFEIQKY